MLNRPMMPSVQPPISRRQSAVDQIGRQMHGDEEHLEAAGEEAEHQQHVAAMAERLGERLRHRLLRRAALRRGRAGCRGAASANDSGMIEKHDGGEDQQRVLPAESVDRAPPRAARTGTVRTNRPRCRRRRRASATAGGISLPNAPITTVNDAAGKPEADHHAGGEMEHRAACRHRPSQARPSGVEDARRR